MTSEPAKRTFKIGPATRVRVPIFCGLMGPSSSGKTVSALRLAAGITKITKGRTCLIDTEANRATYYANDFDFDHLSMSAPFSPADYSAAIEAAVANGADTIIIDQMSYEHEGRGGLLEMHDAEVERLMKSWKASADVVNLPAWNRPKRERRKLINALLGMSVNFLLLWRAKGKMKIRPKEKPLDLGLMPVTGDEWVYDMAVNMLFPPGAAGVPDWNPPEPGAKLVIKRPKWALEIFPDGKQIDEEMGERFATWAAGTVVRTIGELISALDACNDAATYGSLGAEARVARRDPKASKDELELLKIAAVGAKKRIDAADAKLAADAEARLAAAEPRGDGSVPADREPTDDELERERSAREKGDGA